MRNGGDIAYGSDLKTGGLEGTDGGIAPRAGSFHVDGNLAHAEIEGDLGGSARRLSRGERSIFARTFEPLRSRRGLHHDISVNIRQGNNRIIERCLDMSDSHSVYAFFLGLFLHSCQFSPPDYFLRAVVTRFLPLRVRALFFVF